MRCSQNMFTGSTVNFCSYTFREKWVHILQAHLHKVVCFWTDSGFPFNKMLSEEVTELQYISETKDSCQLLTRMHEFTVFCESVM